VKRPVYFFGYVLRLYWKVIIPVQDGRLVGLLGGYYRRRRRRQRRRRRRFCVI